MTDRNQIPFLCQGESATLTPALAGAAGAISLPCLNSNNSTESVLSEPQKEPFLLSPYHKKQAFALSQNAAQFINLFGLDYIGFLTLTFADNVTDHKEAQRRFNSLATHFLRLFAVDYMLVKERQQRGAWHYHLLVALPAPIRPGFNFAEVFPVKGRPRYTSACPYLRSLWKELRAAMPKYGFGRSELAPIKSNEEGIACYVGKYIQQNALNKWCSGYDDKGVRIVSYSQAWPRTTLQFAWNTPGAKEWRRKVRLFAEYLGLKHYEELSLKLGKRWAYYFADVINEIDSRIEARVLSGSRYSGFFKIVDDGCLVDTVTGEIIF